MMTFAQLFILQIIAHVLADFTFQSDVWARVKRRFGFRTWIMYWHILIVILLSWVLSFQLKFILASVAITIVHLLIDGFKVKMGNFKIGSIKPLQKFSFFIDQFLHIVIIWLAVYYYTQYYPTDSYLCKKILDILSRHHLIILLGYLLCLKPTNIAIREIFSIYSIKIERQPTEDLLNAGKLIGNVERVIALTLILLGEYEAIGFIIAGKSILRYEGKKTSKTEYVLIGTLLSFGIAILIGIAIIKSKI
jgi:hypothetical protein